MNYEAELRLVSNTFQKYGILVSIIDQDQQVSQYLHPGLHSFALDNLIQGRPLRQYLHQVNPNTVYIITDWFSCSYLFFRLPNFGQEALLVIGPYLSKPLSPGHIMEQAEKHHLDPQHHKYLERYYGSIPLLQSSSHLHILLDAFFERLWGADGFTIETVTQEQFSEASPLLSNMDIGNDQQDRWNTELLERRYERENMLLSAVRQGQIAKIENLLARIQDSAFEQRLPDQVRGIKNYCIISNTLMRKAAEQGGVHPVYLDQVSSSFAARIEQLTAASEGPVMVYEIAKAYCHLVRRHSMKDYSATVRKAIVLIDSDLSADLSLRFLADHINVNSSYLSALFKKETGKTVTEYITQQRMRYAQHLLEDTRLQIQTIAQLCGILDIHYFSKLFKNHAGLTPKEYRQAILHQK